MSLVFLPEAVEKKLKKKMKFLEPMAITKYTVVSIALFECLRVVK